MTRVAAIDCGTNSLRLLVADIDGDEQHDLDRRLEIVRLGQGVDRAGRFAADALARTLKVRLRHIQRESTRWASSGIRMVSHERQQGRR